MTQRTEMMWAAVTVITVAAAALSLIAAASAGDNTVLVVISVVAAAMFFACAYISWSAGSRYRKLSEIDSEIECFRLKKPGAGTADVQRMAPKGKMPVGKMSAGKMSEDRLRDDGSPKGPVPAKGKMPKV